MYASYAIGRLDALSPLIVGRGTACGEIDLANSAHMIGEVRDTADNGIQLRLIEFARFLE